MQNIEIFEVGYCVHPEFMVLKGGSFKTIKFPAMVALIKHKNGNLLFDTGYSKHFFEVTKEFPEKLYALTTPVMLDKSLIQRLTKKIDFIFISHFHADHISGIKDFPEASIFCSKEAYLFAINKNLSRFSKTKKGVLPKLLGDDFEKRVTFIEDLPKVVLPDILKPFENGFLLFDDIYLIELKGHAKGQYGLFYDNYFFISDAVWNMQTITHNKRPNILTALIMENWKEYNKTIDKLQELHKNSPQIKVIPTHCSNTLKEYINA
ncbi:MBL fold metallo-hydrolase [Arcobacter vandammei]|uniref:MBL fold metallo-hydrolase n=1 Tax=Arcobacter vandammei TaxID=2782243 RepID=UPI0018DEFC27|nr:MBL fold metallo-hydrolase [Arcobacter vandammei]